MRIQRFLNELCIFKHRASTTENEHRAGDHVYQLMRSIGLVASIEEFKSQKRMAWEMIAILMFFMAEVIFYFSNSSLSVVSGFLGLILFWGYFTTRFKPLSPLFNFSKSRNIIGKINNPDASFKIVFTAHYDTARSGFLWNPKRVASFRFNFLSGFSFIILLFVFVILKPAGIEHSIISLLVILIGGVIIGQILIQLISVFSGKPVNGASDNASGVAAMLDLAAKFKENHLPEIEYWFVATGSEEVGAIGMKDFLKKHKDDFDKENTYFINLDNIGSGNLHYYLGEGMLNFYRFSRELIEAAKKAASLKKFNQVTPAKYRLAYTDAIVPASRGYKSILFLATDDRGMIPNWHWETDTTENIDFKVPKLASNFIQKMVTNLYQILKDKIELNKKDMKQIQERLSSTDEFADY
ncbi:hypothetical protein B6I21_04420 [candidate division KSB1 bacterium 4572_119]|nr:MAG: hypothetical protein B6I21_04420 [candidate division KSB1 bacterium 4572_119]